MQQQMEQPSNFSPPVHSHVSAYTPLQLTSSEFRCRVPSELPSFVFISALSFTIFIQQSSHLQSGKGRENSSAANVVQPGPGFLEPEDCFVLCCFHTWHPCGCQSSRQAKRPLHIMPPYLLVFSFCPSLNRWTEPTELPVDDGLLQLGL